MAFAQLHAERIDAPATEEVDRINVSLALVNWCFLLLAFCALLLAKTLPVDPQLTGGLGSEDCKSTTVACQDVKAADEKPAKSKGK